MRWLFTVTGDTNRRSPITTWARTPSPGKRPSSPEEIDKARAVLKSSSLRPDGTSLTRAQAQHTYPPCDLIHKVRSRVLGQNRDQEMHVNLPGPMGTSGPFVSFRV